MDQLWTPWRYAYITGQDADAEAKLPRKGVPQALAAWWQVEPEGLGCVFCNMLAAIRFAVERGMPQDEADRAAYIVARGAHNFVVLNAFPYNSGHAMIVPFQHESSLAALPEETAAELMAMARKLESVLRRVYSPDGLNLGLNLGESAGAGVAHHLHMHAVPRWSGDTNFMTVLGETRILPEMLEHTWQQLHDAWHSNS